MILFLNVCALCLEMDKKTVGYVCFEMVLFIQMLFIPFQILAFEGKLSFTLTRDATTILKPPFYFLDGNREKK